MHHHLHMTLYLRFLMVGTKVSVNYVHKIVEYPFLKGFGYYIRNTELHVLVSQVTFEFHCSMYVWMHYVVC